MSLQESISIVPASNPEEQSFRKNKFGTVVRALWPTKPALHLSQRMGITERGAQYLIDGERKVTLDAVMAIIDEIRD
jgi:hypothetical protein